MIKEIDRDELLHSFYGLVAEVEFGNHFEKNNEFHTSLLNSRINGHINKVCEFFGCYEDNSSKPVGFITTVINKDLHLNDCKILQIGVIKELRDKGYGSKLIQFIENRYSQEKLQYIWVRTYAASFEVIHFYGKNGYVPVSVIPDTNGPGDEGTIVMRKRFIT